MTKTMFNSRSRRSWATTWRPIFTPGQAYIELEVSTEPTPVKDLMPEAQTVLEVLLENVAKKGLGEASMKAERICAFLDPRRKSCFSARLATAAQVSRPLPSST